MNCGHDKATRLVLELDAGKGIGLIERKKQGQGKPAKIYVKRFTTRAIPPQPPAPEELPRLRESLTQDCGEQAVQTAEKPQSRVRESRSLDCAKAAASYIKSNQTDSSQLNPSIHPSLAPPDGMDRSDCRAEVMERIEYDALCLQYSREDMTEVVELLTETLLTRRPTVRIGGEDIPTPDVKRRLLSLDFTHVEYVFDCLQKNTTQIRNIRAYLLTALYNAPVTISNYYRAAVQHDWPSG